VFLWEWYSSTYRLSIGVLIQRPTAIVYLLVEWSLSRKCGGQYLPAGEVKVKLS
jgi:hypothetical protein